MLDWGLLGWFERGINELVRDRHNRKKWSLIFIHAEETSVFYFFCAGVDVRIDCTKINYELVNLFNA